MSNDREADVQINGVRLGYAESMTLRVALESFATDLRPRDALGDDKHGRAVRDGYLKCIAEIRKAMYR